MKRPVILCIVYSTSWAASLRCYEWPPLETTPLLMNWVWHICILYSLDQVGYIPNKIFFLVFHITFKFLSVKKTFENIVGLKINYENRWYGPTCSVVTWVSYDIFPRTVPPVLLLSLFPTFFCSTSFYGILI